MFSKIVYEATRAVIVLNGAGRPVGHAKNVVTITTTDGLPNYGASPPISIPHLSILMQVATLVTFVTAQAVRSHAPTITPKFVPILGCVNCNIIDYQKKSGKTLYKRETISLYT